MRVRELIVDADERVGGGGFLMIRRLRLRNRRDDGSAYFSSIAVDPDFRRRGIARAAMLFLLEEAWDCDPIELVTHPDNAAADAVKISSLISDTLDSGDDDIADSLRPLYLGYLQEHAD